MDVIKICNMAIGFVGGNAIMSLEDGSVEANKCKEFYEPARDLCLEQRDWTFASERIRLTPLATSPVSEFDYGFQLPSDCFVIRQVSDNEDMLLPVTYQVDGNVIVSNAAIVYVRYTKKIANTSLFSPTFSIAVAHKLAEYIAVPVTASVPLKNNYEQASNRILEDGGSIDGMQGSPRRAYASRLLRARYGSYSYGSQTLYPWGY